MSITYYDQHADAFIAGTLDVQMQSLYDKFLPHLPAGAHILDAGCGSGRDSRYFLQQGFAVTALDASWPLVLHARTLTGLPVLHCRFDEFVASQPLDAIWACASVLHVPQAELVLVMDHLARQLRRGGRRSGRSGAGSCTRWTARAPVPASRESATGRRPLRAPPAPRR